MCFIKGAHSSSPDQTHVPQVWMRHPRGHLSFESWPFTPRSQALSNVSLYKRCFPELPPVLQARLGVVSSHHVREKRTPHQLVALTSHTVPPGCPVSTHSPGALPLGGSSHLTDGTDIAWQQGALGLGQINKSMPCGLEQEQRVS